MHRAVDDGACGWGESYVVGDRGVVESGVGEEWVHVEAGSTGLGF